MMASPPEVRWETPPPIASIVVDSPAPLGPSTPKDARPRRHLEEMPSTAVVSPYFVGEIVRENDDVSGRV
ncbi:hypothetical protein JOF47_001586 [Paeniglutamicibacter kerguelensis]|uniref:Uncharacterized protein n=1 Tax=Paeniglutamicibacter kerguelensis TaxID=254788 RepID=A0ABS4XC70_9MICC|nr:hypothetical protein [Paeniglutamicibacter kerguelensis]